MRGSLSVFGSNQPNGGFDCPGCAWPDHKSHKTIDVCETGIKVLASEVMSAKADADFLPSIPSASCKAIVVMSLNK
nr:hypothetical protein [Psychrobacter sp. PraFG1]UNK05689.1 hypothetical protein MN210_02215 [Psychrobacter sp. PraFG1]